MSDGENTDALVALPRSEDRAVVNGAASVSALRASVPSAREMRMEWSADAGPVVLTFPSNLTLADVSDIAELVDLTLRGAHRRAQAIDARRAETQRGSVHESAVPQECAQTGDPA